MQIQEEVFSTVIFFFINDFAGFCLAAEKIKWEGD